MSLVPLRVLLPLGAVVVLWGAAHLIGGHSGVVSPAVWPISAATPTPLASAPATVSVPTPAVSTPGGSAVIPFLPGALQQLNGQTAGTAVGIYALLQQLETALSSRLAQLSHQLEPGR